MGFAPTSYTCIRRSSSTMEVRLSITPTRSTVEVCSTVKVCRTLLLYDVCLPARAGSKPRIQLGSSTAGSCTEPIARHSPTCPASAMQCINARAAGCAVVAYRTGRNMAVVRMIPCDALHHDVLVEVLLLPCATAQQFSACLLLSMTGMCISHASAMQATMMHTCAPELSLRMPR